MARVVIEMLSGRGKEKPAQAMEVYSAPDWVKLALMESPGNHVIRVTYTDNSFIEYRLVIK